MLFPHGERETAGTLPEPDGTLQSIAGLLYPPSIGAVGGEQKRVAIARALAVEPQCLIFDEATNGFDLPLRKKIIDEIIDLQQQLGFTLIFITHDMELAVVVADEIFVMRNSNLVERAAFSGDYSVFHDPYSRMLLEASGLVDTSTEWNDKTKERIDLK